MDWFGGKCVSELSGRACVESVFNGSLLHVQEGLLLWAVWPVAVASEEPLGCGGSLCVLMLLLCAELMPAAVAVC